MKLAVSLCLLLFSSPLFAQTGHNSSASACATAASSVTYSLTVNPGSNLVAVFGVTAEDDAGVANPVSVVFNTTQTGTEVVPVVKDAASQTAAWMASVLNPAITTANVVASWGNTEDILCSGTVVLTGSGTNRTGTSNSGVNLEQPDLTITSLANDWTVDAIGSWCHDLSIDGGQTFRTAAGSGDCGGGVPIFGISMSTEVAAGSSTGMGWTKGGTDYQHAYVGAAFIPAGAVGSTFRSPLVR